MKQKIKQGANTLLVASYGVIGTVHAEGLPTITGPTGAAAAASSPTTQLKIYAAWAVTFVVFSLMALLFATVLKNGWQKYHQLGEEGSKVTWRDLGSNVAVGVVLLSLGGWLATKAVDILGGGSLG